MCITGAAVADFEPNFVLVVTWINLADDVDNCRQYSHLHKLYGSQGWFQDPYYQQRVESCRLRAKTLNVSVYKGQRIWGVKHMVVTKVWSIPHLGINSDRPGQKISVTISIFSVSIKSVELQWITENTPCVGWGKWLPKSTIVSSVPYCV